ncbi:MAG: holin family protein [Rhodobacter sp.]|nr:holin family protein [Rhodobacter sp.]MCA3511655.1 holin family protein [Rhodobacter sp.]MCA3519298.1 holin family protein [Rhodobacter sp.]MCA3522670.1 holin family protein [Rhodobacter sp.]MCA3525598.1 holin family protein [Rhodobacter sp.]
MGLIGRILGGPGMITSLGATVRDVSEVFTENATRRMELAAGAQAAALAQHSAEFAGAGTGWFDRLVNGLNRLPRPMLAFGTLALFGYAMVDPDGFAARMTGLNQVPEPLWWLLGAIVGFYFGAREAHHFRARAPAPGTPVAAGPARRQRQPTRGGNGAAKAPAPQDEPNAALDDWRRSLAVPPTAGAPEAS